MRGHTPITIDDFMGLYDRGRNDAVPVNHFSVANNIRYGEREFSNRYGTNLTYTDTLNIKKFALYKRVGEATRLLILNNSGNLYDSTNPGTPILSIASMTGFRVTNFYGRAYITPVDIVNGIGSPGEAVYVYNGTGTARKAAGARPSGTITAIASGLSGHVETGYHLYAVAYETESGFITKPGPAIYAVLLSDSEKKVEFTNIPVGPAGTIKKHLLATRAIQTYDGNQEGYEFFFIPGADIDNNNTVATVDFYDADLFKSADYLFDQLEEIPACVGVGEFKSRLIAWNQNVVYVSKIGDPESIDALAGFCIVGPSETSYLTDCIEYRDVLYMHKKFRAFSTQDNGGDPATWQVISIDKGTGCDQNGVIRILDAQGANIDKFIVCSHRGAVLFSGLYGERELTYKIQDIWKRINKSKFHLVHGYQDCYNSLLFIAIPLDASSVCSHILMGDYTRGMSAENIRWSLWSFPWNAESVLVDISNDTSLIRIANNLGVFDYDSTKTDDEGQAILPAIRTAPMTLQSGYINHISAVKVSLQGQCIISPRLWDANDSLNETLHSIFITGQQNFATTFLANFISEKFCVELKTTVTGEYFTIYQIVLYGKIIWSGFAV